MKQPECLELFLNASKHAGLQAVLDKGAALGFLLVASAMLIAFTIPDVKSQSTPRFDHGMSLSAPLGDQAMTFDAGAHGLVRKEIVDFASDFSARDVALQSLAVGSPDRDDALASIDPIASVDYRDELRALLHRRYPLAVYYATKSGTLKAALSRCNHLAFRERGCHSAYLAALSHAALPQGFDPYWHPQQTIERALVQLQTGVFDAIGLSGS